MSDEQTTPESDEGSPGGEQYDAPNQQVVREDGSGPADEGTGGGTPEEPEQPEPRPQPAPEPPPAEEETPPE